MEKDIIAEGIPADQTDLKFCADCSHLIGVRWNTEEISKWRCGHKNNIVEEKINLVTGIKKKLFIREDINYLRNTDTPDVCGPSGRWYERYIKDDRPELDPAPTVSPRRKKDATPDDLGL
jgi:hypothetical protein